MCVCVCCLHYVLEYFMAAARHKVGANAVRSITRGCCARVCVCVYMSVYVCRCVCARIVDWYANCIWLLTCARRAFSTHTHRHTYIQTHSYKQREECEGCPLVVIPCNCCRRHNWRYMRLWTSLSPPTPGAFVCTCSSDSSCDSLIKFYGRRRKEEEQSGERVSNSSTRCK